MRTLPSLIAVASTFLFVSPAFAAGPTCALLDPEKSPLAALLEAKLLLDDSATWVERANIDKVLKEQKLQAMFSPQGVGERVQLGKLLKADVLVMVRSIKDVSEPTLEIVVSETAGGLRLLVHAIPVTKETNADVAKMLAAVKDGLRKHGEKITEVVAVPPFVSRNLETNYDHLKAAFAKLTEVEVLNRKGVVVVELEEAQAMAKELALATPGAKLNRPAPVYLFGEYRHEGKGKNQTVAIKLRGERAGKAVGKPLATASSPADAPKAIREWSASLLDTLAKDDKPRPPAEPKAEADQLVARAAEFRRLGEWAEAAALIEAALLLDSNRIELHADMLAVIEQHVDRVWQFGGQDLERDKLATRAQLRGLEHLEAFVDKGGDLSRYGHRSGHGLTYFFLRNYKPLYIGPKALPESRAMIEEVHHTQQKVLLQLIPTVAKQGKGEETALIRGAILYLPPKEKFALFEKIIRQLHDLPNSAERELHYCDLGYFLTSTPEYRDFINRLAADNDQKLRAVGERLKKRLAQEQAEPVPQFAKPPGPDSNAPNYVTLHPIELAFDPADGNGLNEKLYDVAAAGSNIDVLTAGGALFVMKQKGKPKRVWTSGRNYDPLSLHFDGKYVWAGSIRRQGDASLVVIDPNTEKAWEITGDHGLPRLTSEQAKNQYLYSEMHIAPLSKGRVCIAGYLNRRGWIGVATFDPAAGPTVKVTQDARVVEDRLKENKGQGPEIAFTPTYLITVPGRPDANKLPTRHVVLGRGGFEDQGTSLPLIFDPERLANDSHTIEWDSQIAPYAIDTSADGSIYYTHRQHYEGRDARQIRRISFPGGKWEETTGFIPQGEVCLRFQKGQLNIVVPRTWVEQAKRGAPGKHTSKFEWWQYDPTTKKARLLSSDLPPLQYLATSAHYGSVAIGGTVRGGTKASLYSVTIADPGPNYDFNPITKPPIRSAPDLKERWTSELKPNQSINLSLFIPEVGIIVCARPFGELNALDLKTGELKTEFFKKSTTKVTAIYPLAAIRFATYSSDEKRVRIWDAKTGKDDGQITIPDIPETKEPQANYLHVQLSPDGKYLVVARGGSSMKPVPCAFRLINVESGKAILSFDWTGGISYFTADSSRVLLAEYGGRFRWFKLPSGEVDGGWEFTEPDGKSISHRVYGMSADGSVLVYTGPRNTLQQTGLYTLNGKNGEVLRRFRPGYSPKPGILSADGRFIVLNRPPAQGQITFEVFPTTDASAVAQIALPYKQYHPFARFSPDGRMLIMQDSDAGKLRAFDIPDTQPAIAPK